DQRRRLDGASGQSERLLSGEEYVVPQPRLMMAFHLRQIKIRPAAAARELLVVVGEEDRKIEQCCRDRHAIHEHVLFGQVPPAWTHDKSGRARSELVGASTRAIDIADR